MNHYLLDLDTGMGTPGADHDDGIALAFALRAGLPVVGITTSPGNVSTQLATRNTLSLLEKFGRPDIPVAQGRDAPLLYDPSEIRSFYDAARETAIAKRLWSTRDALEPALHPVKTKAHDFIVEKACQYPGEVTLILCASLTNLALAILVEPKIVNLLKNVVCMGLMIRDPNPFMAPLDRPPRYMNDSYDSDATEIVIRSGLPITFVTADVAFKIPLLKHEDLQRIGESNNQINQCLKELLAPWIAFVGERYGMKGCGLPDVLTLAIAIDPSLILCQNYRIDIAKFRLNEEERYPYLHPEPGGLQVTCAVDVNAERFMQQFFSSMMQ